MNNWIWEATDSGYIHRALGLVVDVIYFDDGSWAWITYHPWEPSETASGFASADEAKKDVERFFKMGETEGSVE